MTIPQASAAAVRGEAEGIWLKCLEDTNGLIGSVGLTTELCILACERTMRSWSKAELALYGITEDSIIENGRENPNGHE